jgi:hypothetical protein
MPPTTLFGIGVFTVLLLAIFVYVSVREVIRSRAQLTPFDQLLEADNAGATARPLRIRGADSENWGFPRKRQPAWHTATAVRATLQKRSIDTTIRWPRQGQTQTEADDAKTPAKSHVLPCIRQGCERRNRPNLQKR